MEYRYELHAHTEQTSRCGWIPGEELAALYSGLGYTGMVITDHLHEEYISSLGEIGWAACVQAFLQGYRAAKEQGDRLGLDVLLGVEIRFLPNDNDFLLYGVDEAFLLRNPFLHRTDIQSFWRRYQEEVLIVQAHPYRGGGVDLHPECVHGVEVFNGNPRHDSMNHRAQALVRENPHLLGTCGSDTHQPGDEGRAAVLFSRRLENSHRCAQDLRTGAFRLSTPQGDLC